MGEKEGGIIDLRNKWENWDNNFCRIVWAEAVYPAAFLCVTLLIFQILSPLSHLNEIKPELARCNNPIEKLNTKTSGKI